MTKQREIKFRAWDEKNKMWIIKSLEDLLQWSADGNYQNRDMEFVVWEQYTGLLDKNGKEIFEGDIVKIAGHTEAEGATIIGFYPTTLVGAGESEEDLNVERVSINDVVIFKDGAFCIEGWTNTLAELMTDWSSNIDPELIEVIGNVHENPELLKDN